LKQPAEMPADGAVIPAAVPHPAKPATALPPLSSLSDRLPGPSSRGRRGPVRKPTILPRFHLPWTLYGYIVGEVFRIFLLGVLAVSIFYTTVAAYQIVRTGLQLGFIWPLLAKTTAYPLHFSIPLALVFGITLTIGRMNSDLEISAMRTHGISHVHVYVPILFLSIVLAVISFHVNGWMVPRIHFEKRNIQGFILDQLAHLGSGVNRTILLPDGEGSIHVSAYDGPHLKRVMVELRSKAQSSVLPAIRKHLPEKLPSRVLIIANEGKVEVQPEKSVILLNLRSVQVCVPEPVRGAPLGNDWFHQTVSITENVIIPLSFAPRRPGVKDLILPELLRHRESLLEEASADGGEEGLAFASYKDAGGAAPSDPARVGRKAASASMELHRRIAFTLAVLTFPVAAASLALLLARWSRLVPFFIGNLVVVLLWYPLLMVGTALGEHGIWAPVAMALPNAAMVILSVLLLRKVIRL
jgi:lipopolysaccharide export LptBFGC system permease protein LptF